MRIFRRRRNGIGLTLLGYGAMFGWVSACTGVPTHGGVAPAAHDQPTSRTPLETAILAGRRDELAALLRAGADPDLANSVGNTALHIAAQTNQPWLALMLLEAGARPDLRNAQGKTFVTYLFLMRDDLLSSDARAGKRAVVDWLRRHGVSAEP